MDFALIREAIDDAVDMVEVSQDILGLPVERKSSRPSILCPFPDHHDHNYGSCVLYEKKGYCFVCNSGFNAIDLVMMTEECGYMDAVKRLAEYYGLALDLSPEANPVEPLIIPGDVFRFCGISDTAGFKKLFAEDRETAFRYLGIMIPSAKNKLIASLNDTLPREVVGVIHERIKTLDKADASLSTWKQMPADRPLRIK